MRSEPMLICGRPPPASASLNALPHAGDAVAVLDRSGQLGLESRGTSPIQDLRARGNDTLGRPNDRFALAGRELKVGVTAN